MQSIQIRFLCFFLLISSVFLNSCNSFTADDLAFTIIQAQQSGSPIPLVTETVPRLTLDEAYVIQNTWLEKNLTDENVLYGFKAGLTSQKSQEIYTVNEPLGGLLLESMQLKPSDTLQKVTMLRPLLELELGFRINAYLSGTIPDVDSLKKCIDSVFIHVEISDNAFSDIREPNARDIVVGNVGASRFIADTAGFAVADLDWNTLELSLLLNNEAFSAGKTSEPMGNQWEAALWLANNYIGRGYVLGKGQSLLTGAVGEVKSAKLGEYVVLMGDEERFRFFIK